MTLSSTPVDVPAVYSPWRVPALGVEAEAVTRHAEDAFRREGWSPAIDDFGPQLLSTVLRIAAQARSENWDGEGSARVEPAAVDYALQFARALPSGVKRPEVWADADGDVAFDWQRSREQVFSVRVAKDGTLTYAGLFGTSKLHGVDTLQTALPLPVLEGIRRAIR